MPPPKPPESEAAEALHRCAATRVIQHHRRSTWFRQLILGPTMVYLLPTNSADTARRGQTHKLDVVCQSSELRTGRLLDICGAEVDGDSCRHPTGWKWSGVAFRSPGGRARAGCRSGARGRIQIRIGTRGCQRQVLSLDRHVRGTPVPTSMAGYFAGDRETGQWLPGGLAHHGIAGSSDENHRTFINHYVFPTASFTGRPGDPSSNAPAGNCGTSRPCGITRAHPAPLGCQSRRQPGGGDRQVRERTGTG